MNAAETLDAAIKAQREAFNYYREEPRRYAMVCHCVSLAMAEFADRGKSSDRLSLRDVATVATEACALAIELLYREDAELTALRAENTQLKDMALNGLRLNPMPPLSVKDAE